MTSCEGTLKKELQIPLTFTVYTVYSVYSNMFKRGCVSGRVQTGWLKVVEGYLVIVSFAVGQALPLVVTVSQERFLTLCTHKMLQTNTNTQQHVVSESSRQSTC